MLTISEECEEKSGREEVMLPVCSCRGENFLKKGEVLWLTLLYLKRHVRNYYQIAGLAD